jgi:hypothetical protein
VTCKQHKHTTDISVLMWISSGTFSMLHSLVSREGEHQILLSPCYTALYLGRENIRSDFLHVTQPCISGGRTSDPTHHLQFSYTSKSLIASSLHLEVHYFVSVEYSLLHICLILLSFRSGEYKDVFCIPFVTC